jgi:hypothetical protein
MKKTRSRLRYVGLGLCVFAALALMTVYLASCGGTTKKQSTNSSAVKLPPGATATEAQSTTATATQSTTATQAQSTAATATQSTTATQTTASTPSTAADLAGAHFTVVGATRPNTNKSVISSSQREVPGDYFQVELTIQNTGAYGLIDLSQYSFRLQSPGIAADTYSDYYGTTGTYGAYVSEHVISATLEDLTNLQAVTYKVKVGETVDKVLVFFDLNPETNAKNAGVTKDNTQLIIRKVSGTDYGTQVAIPLTGYPD